MGKRSGAAAADEVANLREAVRRMLILPIKQTRSVDDYVIVPMRERDALQAAYLATDPITPHAQCADCNGTKDVEHVCRECQAKANEDMGDRRRSDALQLAERVCRQAAVDGYTAHYAADEVGKLLRPVLRTDSAKGTK